MKNKTKMLVVCGPTASGKSALALQLARLFGGELMAADSMQIYKGLVIGTAATTPEEAGGIPLHLSGFLPPESAFSAANWTAAARETIADISGRNALPVVCGGTGLYLQSLVNGILFEQVPEDDVLRQKLYAEWERIGPEAVHARLATLDEERAKKLHINDKKRILRALEQSILTGKTAVQREAESKPDTPPYNALIIGLHYAERAALYAAIDRRVDTMMASGLLQEAQRVWDHRETYKTAAQAIGYKEFFSFFEGRDELGVCVNLLKQASRNYAKRQLTWFRQMETIQWLEADDRQLLEKAQNLVALFS